MLLNSLILSPNLSAREPNIKLNHITIEDGLSQSSIYCIFQDSKGFMWLGTEDGLNKYDGYTFKIYKSNRDDPKSLSYNYVKVIHESQSGVLWFGTYGGGLNKFDSEKEEFVHYRMDPSDANSLSNDYINSIHEDRSGILWIGTEDGLNKLIPGESEGTPPVFIRYKTDPNNSNSLSGNKVMSIVEDNTGVLWIGTYSGLNKFNPRKEEFTHYRFNPYDSTGLSSDSVRTVYKDRSETFWIGTEGGLNKLVPDESEGTPPLFIRYKTDPSDPGSLSDNFVYSICEDKFGVLWIGTMNGLSVFDREKGHFIRFKNDPIDPDSLICNEVFSIYEGQMGVFWIGTRDGLEKLDQEKKKFILYRNNPRDSNSLSDNHVRAIIEDKSGMFWIGTAYGGLNKFDPEKKRFVHFKNNPKNPQSLSNNTVMAVYEDRSGALWIGTNGGVNKFNPEKQKFTRYTSDPKNPSSLSSNTVRAICEDKSGAIWIGTEDGLNKLIPGESEGSSPTFVHYKADPDNPYSLSNNFVYTIHEDRLGVLWIGTINGLNKLIPGESEGSSPVFITYKADLNNPQSLSNDEVLSIYEDSSGVLWFGTVGGLNKFNRADETFSYYTEKDGLPNDLIYAMLEDDKKNIWISTNKGLSRFNPKTEGFNNYDVKDGLQSNEFYTDACCESRKGEMFFGGIRGLNSFYPDSIKDNPHIPKIVITDFQIFNKSVPIGKKMGKRVILNKSITETEEIILSYENRSFSIEFAALHYVSPDKNKYAYLMEGLEKEWSYVGNRRFTTYTNLPPKEYIFKVKGSNNNGVWNEEGVLLRITVTPPFFQTWWFRGLGLITGVLMIFSFHQIRTHNIRKRSKQLEERVKKRTTELKAANEGLQQEISERKKAEGQIRQLKDFNESIVQKMAEGIIVQDEELRLAFINPAAANLLGYSSEELVGRNWKAIIPPDQYSIVEEADKFRISGESNRYEIEMRRKDGTRIPVFVSGSPVYKEEFFAGTIAVFTDITELKKAEKEIEKRQKYLESVLYNTPNAIITVDASYRIIEWNPGAEKIFGYGFEEVIGKDVDDLITKPDAREEAAALTKKTLSGEKVPPLETIRHRKDGAPVYVIVAASPIKIGEELHGSVVVYTDITEQKEIEAQYRGLFEDMPVGLYRTTPDGKILDANAALAQMLGYRNQKEYLVHGEVDGYVNAEDRKEWQRLMEKEGEVSGFEVEWRTRNERIIWVRESARAVRNTRGDVIYYEGAAEDITERKKAEEELAEERNLLRSLMDNLPDAIFIKDTKSRLITTNVAHLRIMGKKTLEEVIGKTDFDIFPREYAEQYYLDEQLIMESKQPFLDCEERVMDSEGRERWFLTNKLPFLDYKGSVIGVLGISHDITKRKKLEKQLEDFAYIASHDLKAPMRAVNKLATWILDDYADAFDEEGKEKMNLLMGRIKRMDRLIEGILQYTRAGRLRGKKVEVNLNTIAKEAIENLAPPKNIEVTIENKLPAISAEKEPLRQIFHSLISNAIKFMDKPKGKIKIGCSDGSTHWKIRIEDNGPGIDEKYHGKIFQIFQTLESRDERESTGVGLSVAKKIVELYGGKIWLKSRVGEGSTFFFTIKKEGGENEK